MESWLLYNEYLRQHTIFVFFEVQSYRRVIGSMSTWRSPPSCGTFHVDLGTPFPREGVDYLP